MYGRKGERTFMAYRRTEVFSLPEKCLQRPWKKAVPELWRKREFLFFYEQMETPINRPPASDHIKMVLNSYQ